MTSPVRPTTFIESQRLNDALGAQIVLASETFQTTGSFKFRAAYHLARCVPNRHVITASSGNFGQALACACRMLGKRCTVVMPQTSAAVKIAGVRHYGAEVQLIDTAAVTRAEAVRQLALAHPDAYVASAYDDPYVIAGNASLGREISQLRPSPTAVLVQVGGGGLSSGIITGLRQMRATMDVIGVEPLIANDAAQSFRAGALIASPTEPLTIADGVRTPSLGKRNWEILRQHMRGILEVPEEAISEAVRLLFRLANLKAEPTGALAVAALIAHPALYVGKRICCVVSGGNVDTKAYVDILNG